MNRPALDPRLGEAADVLGTLADNSVDALVTDPPAGIGFMGRQWDHDHGGREGWVRAFAALFAECLRVMKPGAHGLVWALPRTSHWTASALEDAGFEIRDVVTHLFGTGFPKSLDVAKAIAAKGESPEAWRGWGTALKPASEHWILVRKPLDGTVATNVLAHGAGGINIDGCRINYRSENDKASATPQGRCTAQVGALAGKAQTIEQSAIRNVGSDREGDVRAEFRRPELNGRWPANVVLDEAAAAMLDEQSGETGAAAPVRGTEPSGVMGQRGIYNSMPRRVAGPFHGDSGGASRFFYVAKPSRAERDLGCEDLPAKSGGEAVDREDGAPGATNPRAGAGRGGGARNFHPTVKSIALMRWLCRLITPPGGLVLDPFMGSGTTGLACAEEGFRFIGIERELEYFEIALHRLLAAKAPAIADTPEAA